MKESSKKTKKLITIKKSSKYYLFIILSSIFWSISYYILYSIFFSNKEIIDIKTREFLDKNTMHKTFFEVYSISFIQILSIILYLIVLYTSKKQNINLSIKAFKEKKKKSNKIKIMFYVISIVILNYLTAISISQIRTSLTQKQISINIVGLSFFIISFLIEKFYYKNIFGKDKFISLFFFIISFIYSIYFAVDLTLHDISFQLISFIFTILGSIKNYFINQLMNIDNINPFYLIFINGIFTSLISLIFIYFRFFNLRYFNILRQFGNNILFLILYFISLFVFCIFQTLSNYYISPISYGLIYIYIYTIIGLYYDFSFIFVIYIIFILFFSLIYCEFISIHCFDLDKYTRDNIDERGKKEIDDLNNLSSISDISDDIITVHSKKKFFV